LDKPWHECLIPNPMPAIAKIFIVFSLHTPTVLED
jgi:hypothetical protein